MLLMLIVKVQSIDDDYFYDDSTEDTLSYVDDNDSESLTDCQYHESSYQDNAVFYRGINDCSICLCQNRKVSCNDLGCPNQTNSSNELDFFESVEYNYDEEQEVVQTEIKMANDFPGLYCASRYPKSTNGTCCHDRMDSCSVQIACKSFMFEQIMKNYSLLYSSIKLLKQRCVIVMSSVANIIILIVVPTTRVIAKDWHQLHSLFVSLIVFTLHHLIHPRLLIVIHGIARDPISKHTFNYCFYYI